MEKEKTPESEPFSLESQMTNIPFLEELYDQSKKNGIDRSWTQFFERLDHEELNETSPEPLSPSGNREKIVDLIEAYRRHGHLWAHINPIAIKIPSIPDQIKNEIGRFSSSDYHSLFPTFGLIKQSEATLKEILNVLNQRYCQNIGFEFKDFTDPHVEHWIEEQIESGRFDHPLRKEDKIGVLDFLTRAEGLEAFLQTKHVGKKRFSLEGGESLIPMLVLMIDKAAEEGVEEFVIGMSHRGRLNVLANVLNKPIAAILQDFDDDYLPALTEGMGDVRYHKGHASESVKTFRGHSIKLTVAPNPSHLESIDPVVEGAAHAKQLLAADELERRRIIPLLIHGDAALSGQGVVYETLQMTRLSGFETGGTLHLVINNQIGFTTSPAEGRSTLYCTDIAKTFGAPVFHLNGEDPESCLKSILFAYEIRQRFHCDVFIDLNCYRKYGHNEGDEPAFTQPLDYHIIRKKQSIRALYFNQLVQEGIVDSKETEEEVRFKSHLQEAYQSVQEKKRVFPFSESSENDFCYVETGASFSSLQKVARCFTHIPSDFHLNPKVKSLFEERAKGVFFRQPIDWGTAELLAYGTLLLEGISIRLSGQDSGRGTFSHRHALWVDQINNRHYFPLAHILFSEEETFLSQGRFEVLNSSLSEVAALGFEYGYSTVCTEGLNIWEAQFGDFVNSAQVIIDQYIASGEQKWGQRSNIVLFLPHGLEGQGPEHSSARFERFLALAGHHNMQIVNPTTPAQMFHLLRRQVKQPHQTPLIALTPKGLLRNPSCVSQINELTEGHFFDLLDDPKMSSNRSAVKSIVLCSGRIYYDLEQEREKNKRDDLAFIRIEQLYPLNQEAIRNVVHQYPFQKCFWVQEEPENMGAWSYLSSYLPNILPQGIPCLYIGRERSAAPATGFYSKHKQELNTILDQVFQG